MLAFIYMYQFAVRGDSRSLEQNVGMTIGACGMVLGRLDVEFTTFGFDKPHLKHEKTEKKKNVLYFEL